MSLGDSLTWEERDLRAQFEAIPRDTGHERRTQLWAKLQAARDLGAGLRKRQVVTVRLRGGPALHLAKVLAMDIRNVDWYEEPRGGRRPMWIGGEVRCDLLFGTQLPPCARTGACPHMVWVYVNEHDNNKAEAGKRAMRRLRKRAPPQPRIPGT